ncbi:protein kinase, partial [Reticulomyxa filosa]
VVTISKFCIELFKFVIYILSFSFRLKNLRVFEKFFLRLSLLPLFLLCILSKTEQYCWFLYKFCPKREKMDIPSDSNGENIGSQQHFVHDVPQSPRLRRSSLSPFLPKSYPPTPDFSSSLKRSYTLQDKIGEGTYGQVFLGLEMESRTHVVIKKMKRFEGETEGLQPCMIREVNSNTAKITHYLQKKKKKIYLFSCRF